MPNPALHTITSSPPNCSTARSTRLLMSASLVTSATSGSAWPPAASISAATRASSSVRRADKTRDAPSRPSLSAVARPMPADAPVIATTRAGAVPAAARWLATFTEHAAQDEPDVRGPFAQTAHEVRVPVAAEGQIDAHAVAVRDQACLQVAADAVQHLELESIGGDALLGRPPAGEIDHGRVVRGDCRVRAGAQQNLHHPGVRGVHVSLLSVCH